MKKKSFKKVIETTGSNYSNEYLRAEMQKVSIICYLSNKAITNGSLNLYFLSIFYQLVLLLFW
jgi:hypothetical protein